MIITEFKPGDLITRVEPAKGFIEDPSYMGDKLEVVSLENGKLRFRNHTMKYERTLNLDKWGVWWLGWAYFNRDTIQPLLDDAIEKNWFGLISKYERSMRELNKPLHAQF